MEKFIFSLRCQDSAGIVRAVGDAIFSVKGNILENQQHSEMASQTLTMRSAFESPQTFEAVENTVRSALAQFSPEVLTLRPEHVRRRALIMVSQHDHCLDDLLYRRKRGELPVEIPVVVSNHDVLRSVVEAAGIEFIHLPVTPATKGAAELRLLELIEIHAIDFVVLARYMQVLSDGLCRKLAGRVINIHHSFLPGFKGAKPYQQAYDRGVKMIGATAHFVTADLDEGQIIVQDVVHVSHQETVQELVALGRDVERRVLSRAVRLYAEDRVAVTGQRTVVLV